jgi:hypothetical protein
MAEAWTFLPLRRRDGSVRAWGLIDAADAPYVTRWKWCRHSAGYIERRRRGKIVYLHRILLGLGPNDQRHGDHRNGDPADCRRCNLRILSSQRNSWNRAAIEGRGASKYRGVARTKGGRWRAYCTPGGRQHNVGTFDTQEEAAIAVAEYRRLHMPSDR